MKQWRNWILVGMLLAVAACAEAPPPEPAAPQAKAFNLAEPFISVELPPDWILMPGAKGRPGRLLTAQAPDHGPRLVVEARQLAKPLNLTKLGAALARVEISRLSDDIKARAFGEPQQLQLGGLPAVSFAYLAGSEKRVRHLAASQRWLYVVDLCQGKVEDKDLTQKVLATLRLTPEAPPASALAGDQSLRNLLDSFMPARLALAREQIRNHAVNRPRDQGLALLEAEATGLWALSLKWFNRPPPQVDWAELTDRARRAAGASGEQAAAQRALGLLLLAQKKTKQAGKLFDLAVKQEPDEGRNFFVQALAEVGPKEQSVLLRKALALAPSLSGAKVMLARLDEKGAPAKARELYEQVLAEDPRHTGALARLASMEMDKKATRHQAEKRLRQALSVDPLDTASRFNLALCYMWDDKHQMVVTELDQLVQVDPGDAQAYNMMGRSQRHLKRYQEARGSFEAAVKANPRMAPAWYNLGGLCAGQLKDKACARRAFSEFVKLEPKSPAASKVKRWLERH